MKKQNEEEKKGVERHCTSSFSRGPQKVQKQLQSLSICSQLLIAWHLERITPVGNNNNYVAHLVAGELSAKLQIGCVQKVCDLDFEVCNDGVTRERTSK